MIKFIFIIFIFVIIFRFRKTKLKWKTLFKKGFTINNGDYGLICFTGKQGSSKTFNVVSWLYENQGLPIYSNIHLKGIKYEYIKDYSDLMSLKDKQNCVIIYDEIFTLISKGKHLEKEFLSFLSQMRKRKQIFITTAQEWLEINITFRRYCRYQVECNCFNILNKAFTIKHIYDATQMKWSQEDNEYIAPLVMTTISKMSKKIADSYDTLEQIETS